MRSRSDFFLPVRVLPPLFRRVFLQALRAAFDAGQLQFFGEIEGLADPQAFARLLTAAGRRDWVVYAKPPFGGPEQVLAYLSRYTHRVAIANSCLIGMEDGRVTFRWRAYRHGRRPRKMTLDADEFIRRFLLHSLPDDVHRVRHYGFLANVQPTTCLAACRALVAAQVPATMVRAGPTIKAPPVPHPCPCCGRPMATLAVWYHGQAPPRGPFWNDSS
ncbi:transposase [Paracoccus aurantiacus]|uniref:IS91 family transposase n=1 Tax=Paracoccus aurantiacus TaxID=2599412 RepID=UPI003641CC35